MACEKFVLDSEGIDLKYIKITGLVCILTLSMLVVCGCQGSNTVSKSEYDKIVAERDHYKELYENSINGDPAAGEPSEEKKELVIELTPDNFNDYFEYITLPSENPDGNRFESAHYYAIKSKLYDEGWIYRDASGDFSITYVTNAGPLDPGGDIGPQNTENNPIDVCRFWVSKTVEEFTLVDVHGRVRFENINAVENYRWDTFEFIRQVTFSDGTHSGCVIKPLAQIDYPY